VDIEALKKQLVKQDVILPGAYPEKFKKPGCDRVTVFGVPFFGEWQVPKKDGNRIKAEH
jgi:hypothetical protein